MPSKATALRPFLIFLSQSYKKTNPNCLKTGVSHTPTIGVSHTPLIGVSHIDFEATGKYFLTNFVRSRRLTKRTCFTPVSHLPRTYTYILLLLAPVSTTFLHPYPPRSCTCIHLALSPVSTSLSHSYRPRSLTRINLCLALVSTSVSHSLYSSM